MSKQLLTIRLLFLLSCLILSACVQAQSSAKSVLENASGMLGTVWQGPSNSKASPPSTTGSPKRAEGLERRKASNPQAVVGKKVKKNKDSLENTNEELGGLDRAEEL